MTSTNCITGTGFIKCMPITFAALSGIVPASFEIEMLEVLEAKMVLSGTTLAISWKIFFLSKKSSLTASITTSTSLSELISDDH